MPCLMALYLAMAACVFSITASAVDRIRAILRWVGRGGRFNFNLFSNSVLGRLYRVEPCPKI